MHSRSLSSDTQKKFAKLAITTYSELALLLPHSYEDLRLHTQLKQESFQVLDATVESVHKTPNSLQITFFAHNLGYRVSGVLFQVKPYMLHQFSVGSRDYYYGKVVSKGGSCTITMPKKVTKVGNIVPKYKTPLRSDVMWRLIQKELRVACLQEEGIPQTYAQEVVACHFPTEDFPLNTQPTGRLLHALKYIELFHYMKQLSLKRRYFPTFLSQKCSFESWEKTLPFQLTPQQRKAIEDIVGDFSKKVAAKRMVVGDVGSGKTMVMLASAFMVGTNRSLLMAPTTILANQLYEEACKYLPNLRVVLVTNKTKKRDLSEYDCIIGTHALLYRDLPQTALVMVDEQHRFGTKQRAMLEKLVSRGKERPHYIQFSATPIPRTQAMIHRLSACGHVSKRYLSGYQIVSSLNWRLHNPCLNCHDMYKNECHLRVTSHTVSTHHRTL